MSFLLNWRLLLLVALLALYPVTYLKGKADGKRIIKLEWQAATAEANSEARRLENARQSRADEAAKLAAVRESRIRADAVRARSVASGLRNDLDAALDYASKSRAAAEQTARVAAGLLGQCTERYLGVAEDTARADSEARELRQAWPNQE